MTRRLVFGDDQSQAADVAWLWINLHDWSGWEIEALTALPTAKARNADSPGEPAHPREILRDGARVPVRHERVVAEPASALASMSDRDLLVIGPKGGGLRKALHLGSTCDALMNNPTLPLVIARHGVATRRVLVCADGSADSLAAIDALARMPWADLLTVRVMTVPQPGLDARATCDSAAERLGPAVKSVETEVPAADDVQLVVTPRAVLLEAADEWKADLVVMGTRGLSGIAALRAGSIAAYLATHLRCSVLMARAN